MFWLDVHVSQSIIECVWWHILRCWFVQVLVDMIRVPDWAFEAVGVEMRVGQDTAYHPGLYLTAAQVI